jgi:hypothetical protein
MIKINCYLEIVIPNVVSSIIYSAVHAGGGGHISLLFYAKKYKEKNKYKNKFILLAKGSSSLSLSVLSFVSSVSSSPWPPDLESVLTRNKACSKTYNLVDFSPFFIAAKNIQSKKNC